MFLRAHRKLDLKKWNCLFYIEVQIYVYLPKVLNFCQKDSKNLSLFWFSIAILWIWSVLPKGHNFFSDWDKSNDLRGIVNHLNQEIAYVFCFYLVEP